MPTIAGLAGTRHQVVLFSCQRQRFEWLRSRDPAWFDAHVSSQPVSPAAPSTPPPPPTPPRRAPPPTHDQQHAETHTESNTKEVALSIGFLGKDFKFLKRDSHLSVVVRNGTFMGHIGHEERSRREQERKSCRKLCLLVAHQVSVMSQLDVTACHSSVSQRVVANYPLALSSSRYCLVGSVGLVAFS